MYLYTRPHPIIEHVPYSAGPCSRLVRAPALLPCTSNARVRFFQLGRISCLGALFSLSRHYHGSHLFFSIHAVVRRKWHWKGSCRLGFHKKNEIISSCDMMDIFKDRTGGKAGDVRTICQNSSRRYIGPVGAEWLCPLANCQVNIKLCPAWKAQIKYSFNFLFYWKGTFVL